MIMSEDEINPAYIIVKFEDDLKKIQDDFEDLFKDICELYVMLSSKEPYSRLKSKLLDIHYNAMWLCVGISESFQRLKEFKAKVKEK